MEEEHAVGDIFNELKDEFVLSFKRATFLMKFHMAVSFDTKKNFCNHFLFCFGDFCKHLFTILF